MVVDPQDCYTGPCTPDIKYYTKLKSFPLYLQRFQYSADKRQNGVTWKGEPKSGLNPIFDTEKSIDKLALDCTMKLVLLQGCSSRVFSGQDKPELENLGVVTLLRTVVQSIYLILFGDHWSVI